MWVIKCIVTWIVCFGDHVLIANTILRRKSSKVEPTALHFLAYGRTAQATGSILRGKDDRCPELQDACHGFKVLQTCWINWELVIVENGLLKMSLGNCSHLHAHDEYS